VAAYAQDWEKYYTDPLWTAQAAAGQLRLALFYLFGISAIRPWCGRVRWPVALALLQRSAAAGGWHGIRLPFWEKPYTPQELAGIKATWPLVDLLQDNHIEFLVVRLS